MGAAKNQDVNAIIKKTAQQTAQEIVRELERAKMLKNDAQTYFQKTEKLLYSYPNLLKALEQKDQDIKFIQENGVQEKSKSIVFYSTNRGNAGNEQYIEILESYKASKERTERLINKIDRALSDIKDDSYYYIIESKYFLIMSNTDIEEQFAVSDRTVRRHKNRLINKIQVILFGADALEMID